MSLPSFTPCADATAFRAAIAPWLAADPVPHALICGIAELIHGGRGWGGVIQVDGQPWLALMQTPPQLVIIASPEPVDAACVAAAAALLRARAGTASGVNGPDPWVEAIVAALGVGVRSRMGLRLHRLVGDPQLPKPVAGQARAFRGDEDELLWQWHLDFAREALPGEPEPRRDQVAMQQIRGDSLAWTVDAQPVSMARRRRPLLGGWSIGGVYTPPALRGRGYAGAAVQALSAKLLAEGATYVALFTDRANAISNRLYARIGFVPCLDETRLSWNPS